jgi:hypothetical protein
MVHLNTLMTKLMPVIVNVPEGSLPAEMVQPFFKALQHFVGHLTQAEAKGGDKKQIAQMRDGLKMAYAKLTAGLNAPPAEEVIPAAAAAVKGGGGGKRPSVAQAEAMGQATSEQMPNQFQTINAIAAPPKPPTAG